MTRMAPKPARTGRSRPAPVGGKHSLRPDEAAFVEDIAVLYQSFGAPRMMGRLLGFLLICDPPYQSLEQVAKALHASAGSISTITRMLAQSGALKRVRLPGDRRDYVTIPTLWMSEMMSRQNGRFSRIRMAAEEGLETLADATPERRQRLLELHEFATFMEKEAPLQLEKWEREHKRADRSKAT